MHHHTPSIFTISSQQKSNSGKWGLNRDTEISDKGKFSKALSFKTNHIYQMGRAPLVNFLRIDILVTILGSFVEDYKLNNNGDYPTMDELVSLMP